MNTQKRPRCNDEAFLYDIKVLFSYFRGMLRLVLLLVLFIAVSCQEVNCIDCSDTQGNVYTFCDPSESPFDSLDCGEIYTSTK